MPNNVKRRWSRRSALSERLKDGRRKMGSRQWSERSYSLALVGRRGAAPFLLSCFYYDVAFWPFQDGWGELTTFLRLHPTSSVRSDGLKCQSRGTSLKMSLSARKIGFGISMARNGRAAEAGK
jgi:hypothetical protein